MRARVRHLTIAVAAGAMALAGCSSATDRVTEQGLEQLIESQGGGNVDLDLSGDGSLSIQGEDGSSWSMGGTEVPDTWPADVPIPDGYEIESASTSTDASTGGQMVMLMGSMSTTPAQVGEFYSTALSGWDEALNMSNSSGGSSSVTMAFELDGRSVLVSAGEDGSGQTYLHVSHVVERE